MPKKNRSVSPIGYTMPRAKNRLDELKNAPEHKTDPEHIIMWIWEDANIRRAFLNGGTIPLDSILHECSGRCSKGKSGNAMFGRHHYNRKLSPRDIKIVAATIQWLATSVGRGLLHQFFHELDKVHSKK